MTELKTMFGFYLELFGGTWMLMILAGFIGVFLIRMGLYSIFRVKDRQGRNIPLTMTGKTHIWNLPLFFNLFARIGLNAEVQQTFDVRTLKPTIGLRIISLGATALLAIFVISEPELLFGTGSIMQVLLAGGVFYAVLFTNTYTLRYDREGFVAPSWTFQRQEFLWKDVAAIRDNGHYLYSVRMHNGKKIDVQKYLVGIEDFLTYAMDQIALHDRSICPNSPKSKPFEQASHQPWKSVSSSRLM